MLNKKHRAFTLIELLVVIAIIAILSGFIYVSMSSAIGAAKDAKRQADIASIQKAIFMYETTGNALPDTGGVDCSLDPSNATACGNFKTALSAYLPNIPTDPNGAYYVYNHDASTDNNDFVLETTLSSGNTYGYDTTIGFYNNPASPAPPEEEGITITEILHIPESAMGNGEANDVYITDMIFVANGSDGLRAFSFDFSNLTPLAHIDEGGSAMKITNDWNYYFLANGTDGVRVYSFDPYAETPAFVPVDHISTGGDTIGIGMSGYQEVQLNVAMGTSGFKQYSYVDGPVFTPIHQISESGGQAYAYDYYQTGPSNSLFYIADGTDGFRVYGQAIDGGGPFQDLAHIDDGTAYDACVDGVDATGIFVADGEDGLRYYLYNIDDHSITSLGHVDEGGSAMGVFRDDRNYIFLANGNDGLRIYDKNYSEVGDLELTLLGHINSGGEARKVKTIQANGNEYIFLANGADGLRVYSIDGDHGQ